MVVLLCVIRMNCENADISRTRSLNLPILASSSGASTSSRRQKGDGFIKKIEKIRATAVRAFSPPDNSETFCCFFPGGWTIISSPVSRRSSSLVSFSSALPPQKSRGKTSLNFAFTNSKVSAKRFLVVLFIRWITCCNEFSDSSRSAFCPARKLYRSSSS